MKKSTERFAFGTIIAVVVGYLAGLLTAPKSGKDTRKDIKDTAVKGISLAEKELKRLHTELTDVLGQAKERAEKVTGKAKEELEAAIEKGRLVKEKARDLLSAVHEGDAEDKDLQKAIADTTKAVAALKAYLKK
jgi:gas vesicle protein